MYPGDGEGQRSERVLAYVSGQGGRRGSSGRRGHRHVMEPSGPLRGVGCSISAGASPDRSGCCCWPSWGRRHQGRAAGRRSLPPAARVPRVEPQPAIGGHRPQVGAGPRRRSCALCEGADVVVETFSPGTMDRLGLSYCRPVGSASPGWCTARCRPIRPATASPTAPGGRAPCRPARACRTSSRAGGPGPSSSTSRRPAWPPASCWPPACCRRSSIGRRAGRGQHVQTSLYQGVLAYTTHDLAGARTLPAPPTGAVMAKTYPPGVHQTSLYECADGEWIHAATMNGMTPTRTPEEILGLEPVDQAAALRRSRAAGRATMPGSGRPTGVGPAGSWSRRSTKRASGPRR